MRDNKNRFQSRAATFSYLVAGIVLVLTWAVTTGSSDQVRKTNIGLVGTFGPITKV